MTSVTSDQKKKKTCVNCGFQGLKTKDGGNAKNKGFFCSRVCFIDDHRKKKKKKKDEFAERLRKNLEVQSSGVQVSFMNKNVKVLELLDDSFCESCLLFQITGMPKTCSHIVHEQIEAKKTRRIAEDDTQNHFFKFGPLFGREFTPARCQVCNKIHPFKDTVSSCCTICFSFSCEQCTSKGNTHEEHHCEPFKMVRFEIDRNSVLNNETSDILWLQAFEAIDQSFFTKKDANGNVLSTFYGHSCKEYEKGKVFQRDDFFVHGNRIFIAKEKCRADVDDTNQWNTEFTLKDFNGSRLYQTFTVLDGKTLCMFAFFPNKSWTRFKNIVLAQGAKLVYKENESISMNAQFQNMHTKFIFRNVRDEFKEGQCTYFSSCFDKEQDINGRIKMKPYYKIEKQGVSSNFLSEFVPESWDREGLISIKTPIDYDKLDLTEVALSLSSSGKKKEILSRAKMLKVQFSDKIAWDAQRFGLWLKKCNRKDKTQRVKELIAHHIALNKEGLDWEQPSLSITLDDVRGVLEKKMGTEPFFYFMTCAPTDIGDAIYELYVNACIGIVRKRENMDLVKKLRVEGVESFSRADGNNMIHHIDCDNFLKGKKTWMFRKSVTRETFHKIAVGVLCTFQETFFPEDTVRRAWLEKGYNLATCLMRLEKFKKFKTIQK